MLQLGSAEFHKDIEKLSEEAQLIWNLSKFGCVVNVFGSFWGIEINTGARWWEPSCVSLGWKSGTICNLVCVCFWKTAHRSVKTKKCSHWNYYAKACSANWGFFLWSDCWFCFQIKYSFQQRRFFGQLNNFFSFFLLYMEKLDRGCSRLMTKNYSQCFPNVKHNPRPRWTNGSWTSMLGKRYNDYGNDVCAVWLKHVIQNCQILFFI